MNIAKNLTTCAILFASASASYAQIIDYNYAELRYVDSEIGPFDGDGVELAGSYQIDSEWIIVGSLLDQSFDLGIDREVIEIGIGYLLPAVNGIDISSTASVVSSEFGSSDDNGFRLESTGRIALSQQLEARASVNYINLDGSDIFVELGADYFFTPQLAAGAEFQLGSDTDTISVGVRWFFDQR